MVQMEQWREEAARDRVQQARQLEEMLKKFSEEQMRIQEQNEERERRMQERYEQFERKHQEP